MTEGGRLKGLIMDWGGVLTAPLESAMSAWAADEGVDLEHYRTVLRSWLGVPRAGAAEDGAAEGALESDRDTDRNTDRDTDRETDRQTDRRVARATPVLTDATLADLEEAADGGLGESSPVHRLERGELTPDQFEHELAAQLALQGSTVQAAGLLGRLLGGLTTLDRDMLDLVRHARAAGVRTALLSNSWGDHYPDELWDGLFDAVVISGRVGMRKPDRAIFEHTAELLGLDPGECVMVDDLPPYVEAAVAAGMVGVRHVDYATTRDELEALLGVSLHAG